MKALIIAATALVLAFPAYAQTTTEKVKAYPGNATLTGKVKSALAGDAGLKTLKINVDSNKGAVTLKGNVSSVDDKERAGRVAARVEGVNSVKNQLKVKPPKS